MIKKYGIGLIAVVFAVFAAAFTTPKVSHHPTTDTRYKFTGNHGEEGQVAKWEVIASPSDFPCDNSNQKGCQITSTSNVGGHPSSVPLSGGLPSLVAPTTSVTNTHN